MIRSKALRRSRSGSVSGSGSRSLARSWSGSWLWSGSWSGAWSGAWSGSGNGGDPNRIPYGMNMNLEYIQSQELWCVNANVSVGSNVVIAVSSDMFNPVPAGLSGSIRSIDYGVVVATEQGDCRVPFYSLVKL